MLFKALQSTEHRGEDVIMLCQEREASLTRNALEPQRVEISATTMASHCLLMSLSTKPGSKYGWWKDTACDFSPRSRQEWSRCGCTWPRPGVQPWPACTRRLFQFDKRCSYHGGTGLWQHDVGGHCQKYCQNKGSLLEALHITGAGWNAQKGKRRFGTQRDWSMLFTQLCKERFLLEILGRKKKIISLPGYHTFLFKNNINFISELWFQNFHNIRYILDQIALTEILDGWGWGFTAVPTSKHQL